MRTVAPLLALFALACGSGSDPSISIEPGADGGLVPTSLTLGPRIDSAADLGCALIEPAPTVARFLADHPGSYVVDVDGPHLSLRGEIDLFDHATRCARECLVACDGRWACSTMRCGPIEDDSQWSHWDLPFRRRGEVWLPPAPPDERESDGDPYVPPITGTDGASDGDSTPSSSSGSSSSSSSGSSSSSSSGSSSSPDPAGFPL